MDAGPDSTHLFKLRTRSKEVSQTPDEHMQKSIETLWVGGDFEAMRKELSRLRTSNRRQEVVLGVVIVLVAVIVVFVVVVEVVVVVVVFGIVRVVVVVFVRSSE